jgi:hypothetical protein
MLWTKQRALEGDEWFVTKVERAVIKLKVHWFYAFVADSIS